MKISTIVEFFIPKKSTLIAWLIITPILLYICNIAQNKGYEKGMASGFRIGSRMGIRAMAEKVKANDLMNKVYASTGKKFPITIGLYKYDPNSWKPRLTTFPVNSLTDEQRITVHKELMKEITRERP